jgi:hypothetical protein
MIAVVFFGIGGFALYGEWWLLRHIPSTREWEAWLAWGLGFLAASAVLAVFAYALYWVSVCPGIVDCTG